MQIDKAAVTLPTNADHVALQNAIGFLRNAIGDQPDNWEWTLKKNGRIQVSAARDKHGHRFMSWLTGNVTAVIQCSECAFSIDPVAIAVTQFEKHKCK